MFYRQNLVPFLLLLHPILGCGAGVSVNFDPSTPETGPFPTDFLTVADPSQKTGMHVNLPVPDCGAQPSACVEISALNELDGFALQPRIRVTFSAPIDPTTLKNGLLLVWLDNLTTDERGLAASGKISAVNQVVYDPVTNTAYAKPDDFFDQHRQYALVVTDALKDTIGDPVQADPAFLACAQSTAGDYCNTLGNALTNLSVLAAPQNVIAASLFTTMTATSWLEKARDTLPKAGPFQISSVSPGSIKAANITAVNLHAQVKANPAGFQDFPETIPAAILAGVDRIVFNSYKSPRFLDSRQYIANTPTGSDLTPPATSDDILVHTFVPSSAMPAAGYPVVIFGHGFSESSWLSPTAAASNFTKAGFAVMAINAAGHGYGPQTTIQITAGGATTAIPAGGRGVDLNGDGQIADYEGCVVSVPVPSGLRDCLRQTVSDLMQLVRGIRGGVLLENASGVRLDPARIYYAGVSLGAIYGSMLEAVDPNIQVAALSSGGGSIVDIARTTQAAFLHNIFRDIVGARTPSLLNNGKDFNDNYVLRNQPVEVNNIAGAIDLQNLFATMEWLQAGGDPLSYATHLSLSPLPNVPAKKALFPIPQGDRTVPNPAESALIRAAGMLSTTSLYRYDLAIVAAKKVGQTLPADPHAFLVDISSIGSALVANAAQFIVSGFLTSNGATIPNGNSQIPAILGTGFFQAPTGYLETLNF